MLIRLWLLSESELDRVHKLNGVIEFSWRTGSLSVFACGRASADVERVGSYVGCMRGISDHRRALSPGNTGKGRQGRRTTGHAGKIVHTCASMSCGCAGRCSDSDTRPAAAVRRAFDAVACGKERVKALNQGRVSREEIRYAFYDARSVDASIEN